MSSTTSYLNRVTSVSAWGRLNASKDEQNFTGLNTSASSWRQDHLLACRVIRREARPGLLPILSQFSLKSDLQDASAEIKAFIRGPHSALMSQSEHFIVRSTTCTTLAQVWAALATFIDDSGRRSISIAQSVSDDGTDSPPAKRPRRKTIEQGFVDSGEMNVGSSSPQREGSTDGSHVSSIGFFDSSTHRLRITPEDDTVRLASCVIRHILYYAAPQDAISNSVVVDFRDAKTRVAAVTATEEQRIVAIDDGGLCLRREKPEGGFILVDNHVAILEAKTQFQCLENDKPVISDKCFAQLICEALAIRLSQKLNEDSRYGNLLLSTSNDSRFKLQCLHSS